MWMVHKTRSQYFLFISFKSTQRENEQRLNLRRRGFFWKENKGDLSNRQIRIRFLKLEFLGFLRFSVLFSLQCSLLVLFDPFWFQPHVSIGAKGKLMLPDGESLILSFSSRPPTFQRQPAQSLEIWKCKNTIHKGKNHYWRHTSVLASQINVKI